MTTGTIKKLVTDKGFGFITTTDGKDIFFHKNSLVGADFDSLTEGQQVQFEVQNGPKGLNATNVSLV
jgi:CspA family cold shock protein